MISELDLLYWRERRTDELRHAEQQRQWAAADSAAPVPAKRWRLAVSIWTAVKSHMPKPALPANLRHA